MNRERQIMATRFARDAEIGARDAPFHTVRRDPLAARAKLREQMRQFVAQGAIDLRFAVSAEAAIENHPCCLKFRATRRTS